MHTTATSIFNHLETDSTAPSAWIQPSTQFAPRSDANHALISLKSPHHKDTPPVCGHHTQLPCIAAFSLSPNSQHTLTPSLHLYSTAYRAQTPSMEAPQLFSTHRVTLIFNPQLLRGNQLETRVRCSDVI